MRLRRSILLFGGLASMLLTLAWQAPAQVQVPSDIKEKLTRAGVFFRADAPLALRNPDDPYLPLVLEIINGVEKEAHTSGAGISEYLARDPLSLEGVSVYVKPAGARRQFADDPLLLGSGKDFSLDARNGSEALKVADRWTKILEVPRTAIEDYLNKHFLGGPFHVVDIRVAFRVTGWPSQDFYLRTRLSPLPLPKLPGWFRGDIHYHSGFTDNPAERGYPLGVTKQAALAAGIDWLVLSDHSTDLNPQRYAEELQQVKKLRDGRFVFIRGEELTLSSGKSGLLTTVHMVAMPSPDDPEKGFPNPANPTDEVIMTGDGSAVSPALPVKDALARIAAAGGFAYAAHPLDPISPLMRGGSWDLDADFLAPGGKQLQAGLAGLEPWNRATMSTADDARDPFCLHRDADPAACFQPDKDANQYARLEKAIEQAWRPLLLQTLKQSDPSSPSPAFKVFLAAGSDAHGDFNYEATMDVVDFLSKPSRGVSGYAEDNAMGRISTLVFCPEGMGPRGESILRALRAGQTVLSNGPLLVAEFGRNTGANPQGAEAVGIGQEISSSLKALPPLQLNWVSSDEFGPLVSIRLMVGSASGEAPPEEIPIPDSKRLASGESVPLDLQTRLEKNVGTWSYIRLEARTRNSAGDEFRCYTNPFWVRLTEP